MLSYRRPAIVTGGADETDTGKEENGTEYSIYNKAFNALCAGIFHEKHSAIDQSRNAEYGKNNAEGPFYIHKDALGKGMQIGGHKKCGVRVRVRGPLIGGEGPKLKAMENESGKVDKLIGLNTSHGVIRERLNAISQKLSLLSHFASYFRHKP
jgi:hypothetical protein